MASNQACPCEEEAPAPAPGPIGDREEIVRVVRFDTDVVGDSVAGLKLLERHWSVSDLKGGTVRQRRDASVYRGCTPPHELKLRAAAITKVDAWKSDPLVAVAVASSVRAVVDVENHRELCLNANPINDQHGLCVFHGGIVRSEPIDLRRQRSQILTLQLKLCDMFIVMRMSAYQDANLILRDGVG